MTTSGPREFTTPHRKLPLEIPEGVAPTEFFNSPCNLRHLARDNGLLRNPLGFLLYRKAIGHSNLFDTSIIFDTSQKVQAFSPAVVIGDDDHIKVIVQISGPDTLTRDPGPGNTDLIQRPTGPAGRLRGKPATVHGQSRQLERPGRRQLGSC